VKAAIKHHSWRQLEGQPQPHTLHLHRGKEIGLRSAAGCADSASCRNRGVLTPVWFLWHLGSTRFVHPLPPAPGPLHPHPPTPLTHRNAASPARPRARLRHGGRCHQGCSCHRSRRGEGTLPAPRSCSASHWGYSALGKEGKGAEAGGHPVPTPR